MFSLGIRYLNGWAMAAADGAKKERAEWPPHPDRVYMALSAAWFETGEVPTEREALIWLENLNIPPSIYASDASERHAINNKGINIPTVSYVPVNDAKGDLSILPKQRSHQPRSFPVAIPYDSVVHLMWSEKIPEKNLKPLDTLCRKVTHIGHSASFVQMWVDDNPPEPNLVPVDGTTLHRLRIFGPGRIDYLMNRYNKNNVIEYSDLMAKIKNTKGKTKKELQAILEKRFTGTKPLSLRPESSLWQGYDRPPMISAPEIPGSVFDNRMVILRIFGKTFSLPMTLKLVEALRGALLENCTEPIPEWFSGHKEDGSPSESPHLAIVPLPFVDHEHADGHLLGLALAIPRELDPKEVGRCLEPFIRNTDGTLRTIKVFNGKWFECFGELEVRESPPWNLQSQTWSRPSQIWASVTPIVLDRHFKGKDKWDKATEGVKDACIRIGLPRPTNVVMHPTSRVDGVPHAREFPPMKRKIDGGPRFQSHAVIVFDKPVQGPILVGAGRYRGYGLCRPLIKGGGY